MEAKVPLGTDGLVTLRASALVPRIYRFATGHDVIIDMKKLTEGFRRVNDASDGQDAAEHEEYTAEELTIFENVTWAMAKAADASLPAHPDEWLATIPGIFSIYKILPTVLALWENGEKTTAESKKK